MPADTPDPDATSATRPKTWLKPDQVDAMLDACLSADVPTYLQDRNLALVSLVYDTGLRASEVVGLDVDHFDPDDGVVRLPAEVQKGRARNVQIELGRWGHDATRDVQRYLRDRWKDTTALFPTRSSDRMTTRSLRRTITTVAELADVEPWTADGGRGDPSDVSPHSLRHSVAYRIIQVEGGRLEDVQLRLRHANRATTDQVYSHLIPR